MADLEENKNNGEQCLNDDGYKFPEETKDKDIVPFDKKENIKKDETNGLPNPTGTQDEFLNEEPSEQNEDDDAEKMGEYVNKADLDEFQHSVELIVKSSKEEIEAYKDILEKKIKEEIDEKTQTSIKESIKSVEGKLSGIKEEFEKYKENYNKQVFHTVEIVGVFSSVVALLVVNAGIVSAADTFLKASILIVGLSCVIIIFASLIHFFFNVGETRKLGVSFFAPLGILILLLIAGLIAEFAYGEAYKKISSPEKDNISVETRVEQSFSDFSDHNMIIDSSKTIANDSVKKIGSKKIIENVNGKK